jgi:hypothetical protein
MRCRPLQVSTQPEEAHAIFRQLTRERLHDGEPLVAMLEVCGVTTG